MKIHALTQDEALALARQTAAADVQLVAIDYNWGAPISGRFDTDAMALWAAVRGTDDGTLHLQGRSGDGGWTLDPAFETLGTFERDGQPYRFFGLSLGSSHAFPVEFVLRFDAADGTARYDNNGGRNYHVVPYAGRGTSAVAGDGALFVFDDIIPYRLYAGAAAPAPAVPA